MTASLERFKKKLATAKKPVIIGIAGGSGSGKTTLARAVHEALGSEVSAILAQDSYYFDQSAKFDKDGGSVNFDHPASLDFALMSQHLEALSQGKPVEVPVYEFATHTRSKVTRAFPPKPLVIVDGILILSKEANLLKHFTLSIFVDTSEKLRFERRLARDVRERGRTPEGVRAQFEKQVKPMHDAFVEPSKQRASLSVSGETSLSLTLNHIGEALERLLLD